MSPRRTVAALLLAGLPLLTGCGSAPATSTKPPVWGHAASGDIRITEGWVESVDMGGMDMSAPGMVMNMASAAYLTVTDNGAADAIVSASTPAAVKASLHRTIESADGSSGTMVDAPSIHVPAHGAVTFAPGGDHIMLTGLKASFAPGTAITLTVTFRSGRTITVVLPVINVSDRPGQAG